MTKEELRSDSFVEGTARVTHWVQQNFMTVLLGVVVLAAAVVGTVYFRQSQARSQAQASQLMHQATRMYSQAKYSDSLLALDDLMSRFGGTPDGKAAIYLSGASHLALDEGDRASERFREYLDVEPTGDYADSARLGLALAQEGRGDYSEAAQSFSTLRGNLDPEDPLYSQVAFGEARALESLQNYDAAIQVLEPLTTTEDFTVRQKAEARVAVLKAMQRS